MTYYRVALCAYAVFAIAAPGTCQAQAQDPEYGIKFENPPIGSNIRRYAVGRTPLPINKRYQELSREERQIVHNWYVSIAAEDEPPFPADGMKPIHDAIRKAQAKLLVRGNLFLIALVQANGEVAEVKAIGSPSAEMTKFASTVLLLTKFKPALCSGQPCHMEFPLSYGFRVE